MGASRFVRVGIVIGALVIVGGCGSSDSPNASGTATSTSTKSAPKGETPSAKDPSGTLTLVVDGQTIDTGTPEDCNVNDYEGDPIFAFTAAKSSGDTGLAVRLPPEPGTLGERDGNVILPEPDDGDSFQPTLEVTGSWQRNGDTATGHLEGTAKRMSSLTAADAPPPTPFTLDFSCTVSELHLDDAGN